MTPGGFDAGKIFEHAVLAFRRKADRRDCGWTNSVAVIAEQRLGAAIAGVDVALVVEHHDAFGRGVEDGAEIFGIGFARRRAAAVPARVPARRAGTGTGAVSTGPSEQISASAASSSQVMVCRRAAVGWSALRPPPTWLAEIVTGVPASDVLLDGRDAGLDIERIEPAGFFQRMQAGIADALEKRRVGVEQAIEPVDQDAGGQQIEQRLVAPPLRRAPAAPAARASRALAGCGAAVTSGSVMTIVRGRLRRRARLAVPSSLSSRADNCRASSLKALFSTGVSAGGLVSPRCGTAAHCRASPPARSGEGFRNVCRPKCPEAFPRRDPDRLMVNARERRVLRFRWRAAESFAARAIEAIGRRRLRHWAEKWKFVSSQHFQPRRGRRGRGKRQSR